MITALELFRDNMIRGKDQNSVDYPAKLQLFYWDLFQNYKFGRIKSWVVFWLDRVSESQERRQKERAPRGALSVQPVNEVLRNYMSKYPIRSRQRT